MIKQLKAYFKLMRWPNLLMLVVTQLMLNYLVLGHIFKLVNQELPLSHIQLIILISSTVFMAAFGYIFNDVMDEELDQINKKNKGIIGEIISKTQAVWAGRAFLVLSLIMATILSFQLGMIQLLFLHIVIAAGLWYYSIYLKKTVLLGNIVISLFTAISVFIVWLYQMVGLRNNPVLMIDTQKISAFISYVSLAYAGFAFLISLIREIVKDVEDQFGDQKAGMQTFVIKYGISKTKVLSFSLMSLMLILLGAASYISYYYTWIKLAIYLLVAVGIPCVYFMMNLKSAQGKRDFKDLSFLAKIIMLAGILSMQLFYISYGT